MIELRGLTRRFGGLLAVADVDLDIAAGGIVGLIGRNGAGKTTLFNLIAGRFPPSGGTIRFLGEDITRLPAHGRARQGIARTFQIPEPLTQLTVFENVLVGAFLAENDRAEAVALARQVLDRTGLATRSAQSAGTLTTPELKRLELARALATRPKLLLLDEVMAGLRPNEVDQAMALCRSIQASGVTIVIVEHVMYAVMNLCDRVVVLEQGRVIADGSPAAVAANSQVVDLYFGRRRAA